MEGKKNESESISFMEADKVKIQEIKNQINISSSNDIVVFGVNAQKEISTFADTILSEIRSKDTGYVGDVLTDLVLKVKDLKVDKLDGGASRIPILGNLWNATRKFIARYDKVSVQIEKIVDQLDSSRLNLLKDIAMLDTMYEKNQEYLRNLDCFIAAGEAKIKDLLATDLPALKAKAEETQDPSIAQNFHDLEQFVLRFEKRVHDLKLSRMISIQTSPQIRLIQSNNQTLVEKIQSSILNTIPLWKNQIVIAISLFRQKKAVEIQKSVTKTTNDLLLKNSEMLKQGSVEVARENEKGIVEIETLKKVNFDLISTIEETLKIQEEGRLKRKQAEAELLTLENELKSKLGTSLVR
ncbi:MAG: toxic anion resistance protein [Spirochaetales bacterium]|nr:toxic anion resistance protein [Spirochaetales bacterium]